LPRTRVQPSVTMERDSVPCRPSQWPRRTVAAGTPRSAATEEAAISAQSSPLTNPSSDVRANLNSHRAPNSSLTQNFSLEPRGSSSSSGSQSPTSADHQGSNSSASTGVSLFTYPSLVTASKRDNRAAVAHCRPTRATLEACATEHCATAVPRPRVMTRLRAAAPVCRSSAERPDPRAPSQPGRAGRCHRSARSTGPPPSTRRCRRPGPAIPPGSG